MTAWLLLWVGMALGDDSGAFLAWAAELQPLEPAEEVADLVGDYRFQHQVFGDVAQAVRERPGRVEVEQIGTTHAGRPLWAFHVTAHPEPVERKVLVFGGIHALEWISVEVATDLLVELIDRPVPGTRVTVIPLLNPDGRQKAEVDLLQGKDRMYRRGNQKNVDLNRDFPVHHEAKAAWKAILPGYYASSASPLSQPETKALDALAARECYARAASLHAFGGFFYFPWSGAWERPEDWAEFVAMGREMERAQGPKAYKTRQLSRWGFFFRAQGSEIDHLYGTYGTQAWLVELTRSGLGGLKGFKTPFRWYNPKKKAPHVEQGLEAMRVLVRHPPVDGEASDFTCHAMLPPQDP